MTDMFAALPQRDNRQPQGQLQRARQGAPLIAALVDRSGSMSACVRDMEAGLNSFIADQPGAAVMLAQFDSEYELVWPMQAIEGVSPYTLYPRGATALYDAIGEYITDIAEQLGEDTEWRKVVVVVVTDGAENKSQEWTRETVTELIAYWRDNYQWEFVFLGANIDAVKTGGSLGIPADSALTFDTKATRASCKLLTKHVSTLRAGRPAGFTPDDRRKALGQ